MDKNNDSGSNSIKNEKVESVTRAYNRKQEMEKLHKMMMELMAAEEKDAPTSSISVIT
jgi:hypothetical protein